MSFAIGENHLHSLWQALIWNHHTIVAVWQQGIFPFEFRLNQGFHVNFLLFWHNLAGVKDAVQFQTQLQGAFQRARHDNRLRGTHRTRQWKPQRFVVRAITWRKKVGRNPFWNYFVFLQLVAVEIFNQTLSTKKKVAKKLMNLRDHLMESNWVYWMRAQISNNIQIESAKGVALLFVYCSLWKHT